MKPEQGLTKILMTSLLGSAAMVAMAQPVFAAAQVTAVQISPTAKGATLMLRTNGSDRPQVFSVNRGRTWTADLINTQLAMPGGRFQQANPAPGISMVTVAPLDRTSVRVTVTSSGSAVAGQVTRNQGALLFSMTAAPAKATKAAPGKATKAAPGKKPVTTAAKPTNTSLRRTQAGNTLPPLPAPSFQAPLPAVQPSTAPAPRSPFLPNAQPLAQLPPASVTPPGQFQPGQSVTQSQPAQSPLPAFQGGAPLVPNPQIKVDGAAYQPPPAVPPFAPNLLPRAIAPPVGDIAVGQVDSTSTSIDLGTNERVPRLVLRDASAREALSLLARSVGLNIAYAPPQPLGGTIQTAAPVTQDTGGPKVTLDIENEPVQNVFNYILQVTGLEANRVGRTIFVSPRLPDNARSLVTRTLRLNQATVAAASAYLSSVGASTLRSVDVVRIEEVGTGINRRFVETRDTEIRPLEAREGTAPLLLRGLSIATDDRLNSITLVGPPRKVEVATSLLTQLDARRRQVAINVRVIDIDLIAFNRVGASFSFGVNDSQFVNTGGIGLLNFGRQTPSFNGLSSTLNTGSTIGAAPAIFGGAIANNAGGFTRDFLLQLQAAVTTGNAKILTDPTLVVQEGQQAQVQLAQEVITNIRQQVTATQNSTQITVEVEKAPAGLTLPVRVEKIDDNGFISFTINPEITRPDQTVNISFTNQGQTVTNPITLLARRIVNSGLVRVRDGQTLLLSGIIQDEDRATVTKIPILGDIPILGALFRRTEKQQQRREVIVLVTPRILDDTNSSAFGYGYTPSRDVQRIIDGGQR
ncbi:secretin N-terminal domain-containing protein [Leptolyngbyaceae cyanobacterium UHCC 1019]